MDSPYSPYSPLLYSLGSLSTEYTSSGSPSICSWAHHMLCGTETFTRA